MSRQSPEPNPNGRSLLHPLRAGRVLGRGIKASALDLYADIVAVWRERSVKTALLRLGPWLLSAVPILVVAAFLHYYLPSNDVVRIVGSEVTREDTTRGGQKVEGAAESDRNVVTRDVRKIHAVWPNGQPRVYRNEDTDWSFPWYFKWDTSDVQAKASNFESEESDPVWVNVRHYGWRVPMFSMYPNAIDITRVSGPNDQPTPYARIFFGIVGIAVFAALWVLWRRLKRWVRNRFGSGASGATS